MSLAVVRSRAQVGIAAPSVCVEVHITGGLPRVSIVGLPEAAVRESKDRVRSAIINSRFEFPQRRITVNLAPADLPKEGGRFDLPIALGILVAMGQVPARELDRHEFVGELALDGRVRAVAGALPAAIRCAEDGRSLVAPADNADEAALAPGARVLAAGTLTEVAAHLRADGALPPAQPPPARRTWPADGDLNQVRGQWHAKRVLEIAAAGGHNLLMVGPPGTGKTMLARRLGGLLPPMSEREAMESAAVRSVSSLGFDPGDWGVRPFRAPHHTASAVALVGGGSVPRPGEVSLAHNGVLFLDELPEFDRRVLEVLREPLESGVIVISRAARQAEFPARVQLVAAMNPCPCGNRGDPRASCRCTAEQVERYRCRISAPLLDRIDLCVQVPRVTRTRDGGPVESSAEVRERVCTARRLALARRGYANALLAAGDRQPELALGDPERALLERACDRLALSERARQRVLRVARTIADMDGAGALCESHLSEALAYRGLPAST